MSFKHLDPDKHKIISRRGGYLNDNRYQFTKDKAREAARKRWDKVRDKELHQSENVVQL